MENRLVVAGGREVGVVIKGQHEGYILTAVVDI